MIRTFMEVFVGSYKNGTEGTRDYRLTAALYLIGRIAVGVTWSISKGIVNTQQKQYAWLVSSVPFVLLAVWFAFFKPYRKWSHNVVDVLIHLLLAKLCLCFYIVFGTSTTEHTLRIMVLLLLMDLAIPHVILIIYCSIKLALWSHSLYLKRGCPQSGDNEALQQF